MSDSDLFPELLPEPLPDADEHLRQARALARRLPHSRDKVGVSHEICHHLLRMLAAPRPPTQMGGRGSHRT